mmetsp:Transcript_23343/g.65971  ORF Transcript_23343/g.65971 Transcript_23343/m.65971 type:complete len:396 (+) Transcript_23343:55-1242(+)
MLHRVGALPLPRSGYACHRPTRAFMGETVSSILDLAVGFDGVTGPRALFTAVASSLGMFSMWGYVGGPILTFTYLKPLLFGRNFHTVEYPSGSLSTITVRLVSQHRIRGQIAKLQGIPVGSIRHMNVWIDKHFSEPISNRAVMHYLSTSTADGSWILWTREEDNIIPTKGLTLNSLGTDEMKLARLRAERVQRYLLKFETAPKESGLFIAEDTMQILLGLAAQQDPVLLALHAIHSESNASVFRCLALLRLKQLEDTETAALPDANDLAAFVRFMSSLAVEHRRHNQQELHRMKKPEELHWRSGLFAGLVRSPMEPSSGSNHARGVGFPYEAGAQLTAHALSGSSSPLALFSRFQLTHSLFVKHAEHFLHKKGNLLEPSAAGVFQISSSAETSAT